MGLAGEAGGSSKRHALAAGAGGGSAAAAGPATSKRHRVWGWAAGGGGPPTSNLQPPGGPTAGAWGSCTCCCPRPLPPTPPLATRCMPWPLPPTPPLPARCRPWPLPPTSKRHAPPALMLPPWLWWVASMSNICAVWFERSVCVVDVSEWCDASASEAPCLLRSMEPPPFCSIAFRRSTLALPHVEPKRSSYMSRLSTLLTLSMVMKSLKSMPCMAPCWLATCASSSACSTTWLISLSGSALDRCATISSTRSTPSWSRSRVENICLTSDSHVSLWFCWKWRQSVWLAANASRVTMPVPEGSSCSSRRSTSVSVSLKPMALSAPSILLASTVPFLSRPSICMTGCRHEEVGRGTTGLPPTPISHAVSIWESAGWCSSSDAIICSTERLKCDTALKRWMRATTLCCRRLPVERSALVPCSQGCFSASLAVGRLAGSLLSRNLTKSLASSLTPCHHCFLKSTLSLSTERQMAEMEGLKGFLWSSKGSMPVSSWQAMTPALQMSEGVPTWELRVSGAMNQGVPSTPRLVMGISSGSKGTARPKSMAFRGARSSLLSSMKFPGLMSRCRMWCAWHCASVRSTARM
mmetsp:Transcript_27685/g.70523  ORF Transcript_27685/g.70523 Transcript_27685/m.70523 type:complete len:581 (-) Transcript_27685:676-2418(-)